MIQGVNNIQKDGTSVVDDFEERSYEGAQLSQFFDIPFYGYPFSKLFKRDVIERNHIRFDEKVHLHEDNLFMLDYLLATRKVQFISGTNYFYRYTPGSLSLTHHPADECLVYYKRLKNVLFQFDDDFDVMSFGY